MLKIGDNMTILAYMFMLSAYSFHRYC